MLKTADQLKQGDVVVAEKSKMVVARVYPAIPHGVWVEFENGLAVNWPALSVAQVE